MSLFDHRARLEAARSAMDHRGVDCLLVSVGSDLPYLTGYAAMPLERLTMLVMPAGDDATLVVPRLEAPRVEPGPFEVRAWDEHEDAVAVVAALAGRPTVAAMGDQTWSVFLMELLSLLPETTFVPASNVIGPLRAIKDPAEVDALRRAAQGVDRVAARIPHEVRFAGSTERDVARRVAEMTVEEGHDEATFRIVASGPNGASPHHESGGRIIQVGDAVVIDFGGKVDGYCSDTTRTFVVGEPSDRISEVHAVVQESQRAGREAAEEGVSAESVDDAARSVIIDAGYGDHFIHRLGHGIGLDGHEDPYLVAGNTTLLQPGHAFSIEPGIYLSGRFGVRIEDIAVISDDGSLEVLNQSSRDLVRVD